MPVPPALAAAFLALPLLAAPQDPPTPPGGFGWIASTNNLVVWADGYRTLMDVYVPATLPPPGGWPGVLVAHGGGGDKNNPDVAGKCKVLASMGYVTYAYDMRNHGSTVALNAGWTGGMSEAELLHDSAECHGKAAALAAGAMDLTRLGVMGHSLGGQQATNAAAWSGRPIPCPAAGCAVASYPTVLAVASENNNPELLAKNMPGGTLVNDEMLESLLPTDPLLLALAAGDYPGAYLLLQGFFQAQAYPLLQTSIVPICSMLAWQDTKHMPGPAVDAFNGLLAGAPLRQSLTTGGHDTPKNSHERDVLLDQQRRWFDRYLKSVANGADLEAPVEVAVQADQPDHMDLSSIWEHRSAAAWPPAIPATSMHLRGAGALSLAPAPSAEVGPAIAHAVAPGYDLLTYKLQHASKNPPLAFASIPKVAPMFVSPPLPSPIEIFGRGRVVLHVDDTTGVFQLSAELKHASPAGVEQFITFGTAGVRSGVVGIQTLEFDFGDIAHVVPPGNRLVLRIMNLAHHAPPSYERIRFAPYFTSTTTTIRISPSEPSRIELPTRPYQVNLQPRFAQQSVAAGIAHGMTVSGGPGRAGWVYAVLLGGSGEAPETVFPGVPPIPLVFDALTIEGANAANGNYLPSFVGLLDAQGFGAPGVLVPPSLFPLLEGVRMTFAGIVLDPAGPIEAFGPTTLEIGP